MTSPKGVASGMTVRFVSIIEDTRCPSGQTCDEPGQVAIRIFLRSDSPLGESEMVITQGQEGTTLKKFGKFSVAFLALDPGPGTDGPADPDDVRATLVILLSGN